MAEHEVWQTVASSVAARLVEEMRAAGVETEVTSRAKDPDSLLRKMVFRYQSDDLRVVTDKAGARVVVHMPSDVTAACDVVRRTFKVVKEEDIANRYEADRFGYRGIHLDARVQIPGIDPSSVVGDLLCEVQVRTVAEHAWSVLSHMLTYNSPGEESIPRAMRRRISRLVAIVELFDQEARAAEIEITERAEYRVHRLAYDLERLYGRAVGDLLDSLPRCEPELVEFLAPLYDDESEHTERLTEFAAARANQLRTVTQSYDSTISPFIHQPEAFILWERLEHDAVAIASYWRASGYPDIFLENMATVWGIDLPEL